jgi:hypothetical protein
MLLGSSSTACLLSIPEDTAPSDRDQIRQALKRLATRQSVRSAYMSKIRQLLGNDKGGTLGDAADAALEIGSQLLLADIAPQQKG